MNTDLFTGRAETYEIARPNYPKSALNYILNLAPEQPVFADIGAGTGKFTQLLASTKQPVFAVEPNEEMRNQLLKKLQDFPNVSILNGTDKQTHIPDHSVDIITVAQALHWFNPVDFRAECRRIAKAGAIVFALYNDSLGSKREHANNSAQDFFNQPTIQKFPNFLSYDRENWITYMHSHSHAPLPTDSSYKGWLKQIEQIFAEKSENGLLIHDATTSIYWEKVENLPQ